MSALIQPLSLSGPEKIAAACALGIAFGFLLVRSKLFLGRTLSDQFSFKDNRFAITFLVSLAIGIPLFHFLGQAAPAGGVPAAEGACEEPILRLVMAACLTGLGVGLCGFMPCTAVSSLAAGRVHAIWAFGGMLLAFPLLRWILPPLERHVFNLGGVFNPDGWVDRGQLLFVLPAVCLLMALFLSVVQFWLHPNGGR